MKTARASLALIILPALALAAPGKAKAKPDPWAESLKAAEKENEKAEARRKAVLQALVACKAPLVHPGGTLSLRGDGLGGRIGGSGGLYKGSSGGHFVGGRGRPHPDLFNAVSQGIPLSQGTLYLGWTVDFDEKLLFYHLDRGQTLAEAVAALQAPLRAQIKHVPENENGWLEARVAELGRIRKTEDYLARFRNPVNLMPCLENQGIPLTPAKQKRIQDSLARQVKLADELWQLLEAREQGAYPAREDRIWEAYEELRTALDFMGKDGNFFTKAQRRVLCYDPDPKDSENGGWPEAGMDMGGSSRTDEGDERDKAYAKASLVQQDARLKGATLSFALKGPLGDSPHVSGGWVPTQELHTREGGLLYVVKRLPKGSGIIVAMDLDPQGTWEAERPTQEAVAALRAKWDQEQNSGEGQDPLEQARLARATSWLDFQVGAQLARLTAKAGPLPELEARYQALLQEADAAEAALLQAYHAAVDRPKDEALQRAAFRALQAYLRIWHRNYALVCERAEHDAQGLRNDIPWLLTMDQVDLAEQGRLVTTGFRSSSRKACIDLDEGTGSLVASSVISFQARPDGGRQYAGVETEGAALDGVATKILPYLRYCFHNHRLTLTVEGAAADQPVRGMVEGHSLEEVLESLALRTGTTLARDGKDPNAWRLKP